jgi:hypothetical protein
LERLLEKFKRSRERIAELEKQVQEKEKELADAQKKISEQVAAKLVDGPVGESPTRVTCPVAPVVISGGGAGDQSAGSPEVKVLVGWV